MNIQSHARPLGPQLTALILLGSVFSLLGCGGGGGGNSASTTPNSSANNKKSAWIYSFESDRTISRFTADGETGRVYTEGHAPSFLTSLLTDIAIAREGEVIYIIDSALANISLFRANSRSAAIHKESEFPTSGPTNRIEVSPSERFLVASGANRLQPMVIDPTTDELTALTIVALTTFVDDVLFDPSEQFLYAFSRVAKALAVVRIDSTTGELTPVDANPLVAGDQPVVLGSTTVEVLIEPSGRYLYAAANDKVVVWEIDRATGLLTEVSETQAGENSGIGDMIAMPDSSTLYVSHNTERLVTYAIDEDTGELTRVDAQSSQSGVQNTALGFTPRKMLIGPAAKRLLVFQTNTGLISNFELEDSTGLPKNPTTIVHRKGTATLRALSANRSTPALRDPNFLFLNGVDGPARMEGYRVDPVSGDLTLLESIVTMRRAKLISDRANRFLYSVNNDVEGFEINHETGLLTSMGLLTGPNGNRPVRAVVNPSGWAMYSFSILTGNGSAFASYNCGLDSALSPLGNWSLSQVGGPDPTIFSIGDVAVDPLGKTAYLSNARVIRAYPINARDEVLARLDSNSTTPGIQDYDNGTIVNRIACDPLGRYLYSVKSTEFINVDDGHLSVFRIDARGAPLLTDADAILPGLNRIPFVGTPSDIFPDPSGRFVYVSVRVVEAGFNVFAIAGFALNESTGQLAPIDADLSTPDIDYFRNDQPGAGSTIDHAIDPSGRFYYISTSLNGNAILARYMINQQTGALENLSTVATTPLAGNIIVTGSF